MPDKLFYINSLLNFLTAKCKNPRLPHLLFLVGTYFFPQVNVELVVRINKKYLFFAWRDDDFGNKGWHLPGGIIRPNEKIISRVKRSLSMKYLHSEISNPSTSDILASQRYSIATLLASGLTFFHMFILLMSMILIL